MLQSQDGDTPTFQSALLQLAKAMNSDSQAEAMDMAA